MAEKFVCQGCLTTGLGVDDKTCSVCKGKGYVDETTAREYGGTAFPEGYDLSKIPHVPVIKPTKEQVALAKHREKVAAELEANPPQSPPHEDLGVAEGEAKQFEDGSVVIHAPSAKDKG